MQKANLEKLLRGVVDVIQLDELKERLAGDRPLRVKAGFDPTAPDIHLGHTVLLNKLRQFQDEGHHVVFIIGDFTAMIGDPTGRSELRKPLSRDEVKNNAKTYQDQAFKILDKTKTEVVFNSQWYDKMDLSSFSKIAMHYTVARLLERDDFSKRFKEGRPISVLELLYPLIQAYDSVMVNADIELGGTDQKFNLLVGRTIQEAFGQKPQVVMTLPLLEGTDGVNKMSKSLNNYIGVSEPPKEIFGKAMSISDELMYRYYELLTDLSLDEIKTAHPKDAKERLAYLLVERFYGKEAADKELEAFRSVFSEKKLPEDMPQISIEQPINIVDLLVRHTHLKSKNEARRLISQGGLKIDNDTITSLDFILDQDTHVVLKVGKRHYYKVN